MFENFVVAQGTKKKKITNMKSSLRRKGLLENNIKEKRGDKRGQTFPVQIAQVLFQDPKIDSE